MKEMVEICDGIWYWMVATVEVGNNEMDMWQLWMILAIAGDDGGIDMVVADGGSNRVRWW